MINHPLHKTIGKLIDNVFGEKYGVVKDPACETTKSKLQNIPLFCSEEKSNKTELCNVDILMLENGKIKVIVEIEVIPPFTTVFFILSVVEFNTTNSYSEPSRVISVSVGLKDQAPPYDV